MFFINKEYYNYSPITGKLFVQKVLLSDNSWDQELLKDNAQEWSGHKEYLLLFNKIRIPRWIQSK